MSCHVHLSAVPEGFLEAIMCVLLDTSTLWSFKTYFCELTTTIMPGRPKSLTKKAQISRQEEDHIMDLAMAAYHSELDKAGSKKGLC